MVNIEGTVELQAEIQRAREAGATLDVTEPRAIDAWSDRERIFLELTNGVVIGFPYELLQGLEQATPEQWAKVEVTPSGYGLHWEQLDVDLGVPQLVAGVFGTKAWMTELGRRGGQAKSIAKGRASRENGRRGGRPRKVTASR